MDLRPEEAVRDRAIWIVRLTTFGSVVSALGLTWLFSNLADDYFSGKTAAAKAPNVPVAATPVQKPPAVITTVVHHPSSGGGGGGAAPRPPAQPPAAAPPAPPPPPVCHSTPSKPC